MLLSILSLKFQEDYLMIVMLILHFTIFFEFFILILYTYNDVPVASKKSEKYCVWPEIRQKMFTMRVNLLFSIHLYILLFITKTYFSSSSS